MDKPTIQKLTNSRYNYRVRFSSGGKTKNKYFKTKSEAETFVRERKAIESRGPNLRELTDNEAAVVRLYRDQIVGRGYSLAEAFEFFIAHLEEEERQASMIVYEVADDMLANGEAAGLEKHHLIDYRSRLARFGEDYGNESIASIELQDIDDWLKGLLEAGLEAQTVLNYRRCLHALFEFASDRGHISTNPVTKAFKPKVIQKPPGVLTPDEVARLLKAAPAELVPILGVQLFGGMRNKETQRLTWDLIKLEEGLIHVTEETGKGARSRHVEINEPLRSCLQPYRPYTDGEKVRLSRGSQWLRNTMKAAREKAGITDWPHNALRHSFASYHLAFHGSADKTALQLGHTDATMLFKHYRALVSKDAAEEFWAIRHEC